MDFPITRLRRLRQSAAWRRMAAETELSVSRLIEPLFVCGGSGVKKPIPSLAEYFHLSADQAAQHAKASFELGIPAVLLFGLPEKKDALGSEAWSADNAVCRAIRAIKAAAPELLVITDVCLCAYTDHGHCGAIKDGRVDNDATLDLLCKVALAHATAGADIVAPSDMMDGRVLWLRRALDEAGFIDTAILSYAVKFASAFYGPFRDAADSRPAFGDRKTYQLDPAAYRQALREAQLDAREGADALMVKPALPYLDILAALRARHDLPLAAYQVSGEYMMLHQAAAAGLMDLDAAMRETLLAIRRAGADWIITYFARRAAKRLGQ